MAMLIDRRYNPFRDFEDIDRSLKIVWANLTSPAY